MRRIERYEDEQIELERLVEAHARGRPRLKVLEAGCGREWYLRPEGVELEITGIDLDRAALEHRRDVRRDLHRAIHGDLKTAELPPGAYDVVYSSFVLEHVEGAETALENMVNWLRPGGLLIVRVPDLEGVQTFLARRLPRWVAVAYYRHAWKIKDAG
ncbi:MAG: class I SAM-dependent methyltransferase, partial [Nitratireductor sp.]|nr:class I SAM-dependent methyltransferase [Nitratireductor sp.]